MPNTAELAAYLVTEGMLPMIAGQPPLAAPPQNATPLTHEDRVAAGFAGFGVTMRYGADDGDVLGDMGPHTATVQFDTPHHAAALETLRARLASGLRDVQTGGPAPLGGGRSQDVFMVRVSEKRYARVTAIYHTNPDGAAPFQIAVTGMEAVGHRSGGAQAPAHDLRGTTAAPHATP